jgi:hypothetical protein
MAPGSKHSDQHLTSLFVVHCKFEIRLVQPRVEFMVPSDKHIHLDPQVAFPLHPFTQAIHIMHITCKNLSIKPNTHLPCNQSPAQDRYPPSTTRDLFRVIQHLIPSASISPSCKHASHQALPIKPFNAGIQ